ncbi:MAG: cytochrome ubiquinol oxidase subunit I, partial [Candidatus Kariarchaeaceae archaeon]
MGIFDVFLEIKGRRTNDKDLLEMSRVISKVTVVIFAVGAVTGTLSEFGLIIFWPNLLNLVGKYFFFPLYLEVFCFLAEGVFIYMYYYTWDRVDHRFHQYIGILAVIGGYLVAMMILSVNNLMHIPYGLETGYDSATGVWSEPTFALFLPGGGSAVLTSQEVRDVMLTDIDTFQDILAATVKSVGIFGVVFRQPGVIANFAHTSVAATLSTIYTIMGVYSWRFLKTKNEKKKEYYIKGIKFFSVFALILIALQGTIIGHAMGQVVAEYNPEKL